jgi:hypothetical protein
LTHNEHQSTNCGRPIVGWKGPWTGHRFQLDSHLETPRRSDGDWTHLCLSGATTVLCSDHATSPNSPPGSDFGIMPKAVAHRYRHPSQWLGIRRGTALCLFGGPFDDQKRCGTRKTPRQVGRQTLSDFIGEQALEAFLCIRETITDSWVPNSPRQASIPGLRTNDASRKVLLSSAKRKFREQLPPPHRLWFSEIRSMSPLPQDQPVFPIQHTQPVRS